MSFLHLYFLYFIPLILIPLLSLLLFRMNRKKMVFPSLEIIQGIMKKKLSHNKLKIRLKQLIRFIIIALVILAFAGPVPGSHNNNQEYTVIIDNTLSMSLFEIDKILSGLNDKYTINKTYFGKELYDPEKKRWDYHSEQTIDILSSVLAKENIRKAILITDGQKANFKKTIQGYNKLQELIIIILKKEEYPRNIYIKDFSYFPLSAISGKKTEFTINVGGDCRKNDKLTLIINDKIIFSGTAEPKLRFSRFLENTTVHRGLNWGIIRLEGDDFTNDNYYYFPILAIPKPRIYNDFDSSIITRIMNSIFDSYYFTRNPLSADIVFSSTLSRLSKGKINIAFYDNNDAIENALRPLLIFPEFKNNLTKDKINSSFPILGLLQNVSLKTRFVLKNDNPSAKLLAGSGNIPLLYEIENKDMSFYLFTFSIKENEEKLNNSSFLLLTVNEVLMRHYIKQFIIDKEEKTSGLFYDQKGRIADVKEGPGIYMEKTTGKYIVENIQDESVFDYYTEKELFKMIEPGLKNKTQILSYSDKTEQGSSNPLFSLSSLIILIAIILMLVEIFL